MYEVESMFADSVIKCPKRSRYAVLVHCLQHFDPLRAFTYTCKMVGKLNYFRVRNQVHLWRTTSTGVCITRRADSRVFPNKSSLPLHKDQAQDPSLL